MLNLKNTSISEFEKCGEILVASKRNKLAMSCNFCPEMFSQLQAFMRHLQQQHNNKLEFHKQGREIEVYAVEELISQTAVSCMPDMESETSNLVEEDAKWLSEADIKWLDEGVEPKKKEQQFKELNVAKCDDEEESLNVVNTSILKALEDCDVSFNLMNNLNSTRCSEEERESNLDNSLLRDIRKDWGDSDTNESFLDRINCSDQDMMNCSKYLMEISKELNADVTIPDLLLNDTCVEESLNTTNKIFETSQNKCIKSLLKGLEGLDDVDSLLEDLESILPTSKSNEIVENKSNTKEIFNCQLVGKNVKADVSPQNSFAKAQNLNVEENSGSSKFLLSTKFEDQLTNVNKNLVESKKLEMNFKDFETRLKELENALEEDISNSSNYVIKNINVEKCEPNDFALQFKNLEESLNDHKDVSYNEIVNNRAPTQYDFEMQLKSLEESLYETEKIAGCSNKIFGEKSSETNIQLNEDLTKALADVLDENDLDFLNTEQEGDIEEPINEDILNILERELIENEHNEELPLLIEQHTADPNIKFQEKNTIKTLKKQRKTLNSHRNNVISKYQKTNLKARTKILKTKIKNSIKPTKSLVLTESNLINCVRMVKVSQKPLKGNHEIFLNQKLQTSKNNSSNSLLKTPILKSINRKLPTSFEQRKSPTKENQENLTSALNTRNIKTEKLTPATNFVNMNRGDKTPIKREVLFIKQSPKTQEKQEILIKDITPKRGDETPQEIKIKQSPKTQEKQANVNQKNTTPVAHQKTPQLKSKEQLKQSPKEKPNEPVHNSPTPKLNKSISKEQKSKSPSKHIKTSNEKRSPPTQTSNNSNTFYNNMRTPLTTPQRLKNVTIKLQRFTPDKLPQQFKGQDKTHLETKPHKMQDATNQIGKTFKLPEGISLAIVPKESSSPDTNQCAIIETPTKTTAYCKQNFSESSLENVQRDEEVKSSLTLSQSQTINNLKPDENFSNVRQRKASIDILPSTQGIVNQSAQMSANKTPHNNNLDYINYTVNRTARKNEVLQRMRQIKKQIFKSIEERECPTKDDDIKSHPMKAQKKKVLIENVQILPNLNNENLTHLIFNKCKKPFENHSTTTTTKIGSTKKLADDQTQAEVLASCAHLDSSVKNDEKLTKSLKRRASSPPINENQQAKRQYKSSAKKQTKAQKETSNLERTQLDLPESVVGFLQSDLKAKRLSVESLINEDLPEDDSTPNETSAESSSKDTKLEKTSKDDTSNYNLLNDLLEQVNNEQTTKGKTRKKTATDKEEVITNSDTVEDFDDSKDIDLLSKFGLKIIKLPEIEDTISLEERDEMNEQAIKFSSIYNSYPKVWSTKYSNSPTIKQELNMGFKQLLSQVNQTFNLNLKIGEIKRLANLINIWYSHNFNNKLIEKRKISDSINRHLLMFHYIPKTIKRLYNCEFCEEFFNTEHKYFTHRIIHTGALYPYKCQKCLIGCKTVKFLQNHESKCSVTISDKKWKMKPTPYTNIKLTRNKCQLCAEIFATSEQLYEHSKAHLKNTYSCAKCELVFATAIDVQNHMTACNILSKRMPKQCTPRPQRQN